MAAIKAPLDTLDGIAKSVRRAQEAAMYASVVNGIDNEASDWADKAKEHCRTALDGLRSMGATIPGIETDEPAPDTTPLHLLSTEKTRVLLDILDQAATAGAAVDHERGSVDRDGDPTGWGELMAGLALRLRMDVYGPAGRE